MTSRRAAALALALASALALAGCGGREREAAPQPEAPAPAPAPSSEAEAAPPTAPEAPAPLETQAVTVYFASAYGDGLVGEPREIFVTAAPGDRAKQILSDLIQGPERPNVLAALPPGIRLRQVYVMDDGTAYADFAKDLVDRIGGGSLEEILAVYAVVDSLALNVPEIRRVGILVDGREIDTLNGHLDLRRPLLPDRGLILADTARASGAAPAPAAPAAARPNE